MRLKEHKPTALEATPFTSADTKRRIHAEFAPATVKTIAPKADLDKLRELRAKDNRLGEMDAALTYDSARRAYRDHLNKLAEHVADGKTAEFDNADGWTGED